MVFQRVVEEAFIGRLAVLRVPIRGRLMRIAGGVAGVHDVMMLADVNVGVLKRQPFGVFGAPIVQGGADRLGRLEAGQIVAAVTAEAVDALTADVPFQLVAP